MKIKKLHPDAVIPNYVTEGAACFDLYAATAYVNEDLTHEFTTGLAFEVPQDHVMLVFSRSGHGFKEGASLINCVGVIDSDYRGDVAVKMNKPISAGVGDRIAQAMIIPVQQVTFQVADDLTETKRGQGGFGSTGVK